MSVAAGSLPSLQEECFFIAPIGSEESDERRRFDGVKDYIVAPAAGELGLVVVRADLIAAPGQINRQVIEHVVGAKAAVVDLTGANPNVYYEMAVRHTAQLPTVLIAEKNSVLPFDIAQMRTIFFDHRDLKSATDCRRAIVQHLQEALNGAVDSPIASSVAVSAFREGNDAEQLLAQVVSTMESVAANVRDLGELLQRDSVRSVPAIDRRAMADLLSTVQEYRQQRADDRWERFIDTYSVGDQLEGTVTKVVSFGVFVEILDGIEGLVHVTELAPHHVENPREIVAPGDDVRVVILEMDSERRRLALSVKRVDAPHRDASDTTPMIP